EVILRKGDELEGKIPSPGSRARDGVPREGHLPAAGLLLGILAAQKRQGDRAPSVRLPDGLRIRRVREILQGLRANQLRLSAVQGKAGREAPERLKIDLDVELLPPSLHVQ